MSNKQPQYEKISKELVKEFVKIFGDLAIAKYLITLGCSYTDLVTLGIKEEEAHYAMLDDVMPKDYSLEDEEEEIE
jgi:hypothetical protein